MIRRSVGRSFNGIQLDSNCCLSGLRCRSEKNGHNMTNRQHVGEREKDDNITYQTCIKIRNWKKKNIEIRKEVSEFVERQKHSNSARIYL